MARGKYIVGLHDTDRAYAERNALALAFAALASDLGWRVGRLEDPNEPEWPVLVVETPHGQVSWHIPADEWPEGWEAGHTNDWDGHTDEEKYNRLERLFLPAHLTAQKDIG